MMRKYSPATYPWSSLLSGFLYLTVFLVSLMNSSGKSKVPMPFFQAVVLCECVLLLINLTDSTASAGLNPVKQSNFMIFSIGWGKSWIIPLCPWALLHSSARIQRCAQNSKSLWDHLASFLSKVRFVVQSSGACKKKKNGPGEIWVVSFLPNPLCLPIIGRMSCLSYWDVVFCKQYAAVVGSTPTASIFTILEIWH